MFARERANIFELLEWNSLPRVPNKNDSIRTIECWKYENTSASGPIQGVNYRLLTIADEARESGVTSNAVDDRLENWLQWKVSITVLWHFSLYLLGLGILGSDVEQNQLLLYLEMLTIDTYRMNILRCNNHQMAGSAAAGSGWSFARDR